ncbi:class I SAM-dependent methyltransferase [Streptomyces minutiscleroticus]|uniref:class I SAM-dependent methyltransferase n=1 Tax=Streptomyces minutiscleroticus TaxID=68238 RepID=UPI0033202CE0
MEGLGYGGLAPYFLRRWCQPTCLSGLALPGANAPRGGTLFEIGCGAGHFLRDWEQRSGPAIGSDLVFSHLWPARMFTAPRARLVCFDARGPFPLAGGASDVCCTYDSFHYLPDKPHAVREMHHIARGGRMLLGHVHNAERDNFSPGLPLTVDSYVAAVAPHPCHDDTALTYAALHRTAAVPERPPALRRAAALAFVHAPDGAAAPSGPSGWFTTPLPGAPLRVNPLIQDDGPRWPNEKFAAGFAEGRPYLRELARPTEEEIAAARSGTAGSRPGIDRLAARRVLLDLPERWLRHDHTH